MGVVDGSPLGAVLVDVVVVVVVEVMVVGSLVRLTVVKAALVVTGVGQLARIDNVNLQSK